MNDRVEPGSGDNPLADRRRFFLQGAKIAVNALTDLIRQASPAIASAMTFRTVLRPPGALPEHEFLRTCHRCGNCVDACPVHAIKPIQAADDSLSGTPFVDPDVQACQLCEDMRCTLACPSGALSRTQRQGVRMGRAQYTADRCLRLEGQDCRLCLTHCPVPTAIRLASNTQMEIVAKHCVGCGACQQVCPARPKAILIQPL